MPIFRFTIRRLMIWVALLAGCLCLYRQLGGLSGTILMIYLSFGAGAYLVASFQPQLAFRGVVGLATLLSIAIGGCNVYILGFGLLDLSFLALVLCAPLLVGGTLGWTVVNIRREPAQRSLRGQALIVCLLFLPVSMAWTHWPLHLAFALSRGPLTRLADRVNAGESIPYPVWAGVYRISQVKRDPALPGNMMLCTSSDLEKGSGFLRILSPSRSDIAHFDCLSQPLSGPWYYWFYDKLAD